MKVINVIPKSKARELVFERRREFSASDIHNKSLKIIERLSYTDDFKYANTVYCYMNNKSNEFDTKLLINFVNDMGKTVILPKLNKKLKTFRRSYFFGWEHLVKNEDGFLEPKIGFDDDFSDIDLILVPAVAVSLHGIRIGYGGSYYDNYLKKTFVPKYVLAFEFQLFDYIEFTSHDVIIDKIITERRVIDTRHPEKHY